MKHTLTVLLLLLVLVYVPAQRVSAAGRIQEIRGEKPVIVIDPGHGGENEGTIAGKTVEKSMTMTTALAMYDELCLYEDVEVYLTHTDDRDLSLEERAAFAESVNADFLFSIHYNASEYHELFGAEIWIPKDAPFNNYGYQFGYEFLSLMQERGIFLRGIKTRVGDKGLDYYGIIRFAAARNIPAVILEHCHVDEERDQPYCDSEDDLIRFGKEDATAVARYFGLKSSILGVDYSGYVLQETADGLPVSETLCDDTAPDVCMLTLSEADYDAGCLSLQVAAADYDSVLLYYDFSLDGGVSFSPRTAWPESDALGGSYADTFTLNLQIPSGTQPSVILRAYNLFDRYTVSNVVCTEKVFRYTPASDNSEPKTLEKESETPEAGSTAEIAAPAMAVEEETLSHPVSLLRFLEICFVAVALIFLLLAVSQLIAVRKRKRKQAQRRKTDGKTRNQQR